MSGSWFTSTNTAPLFTDVAVFVHRRIKGPSIVLPLQHYLYLHPTLDVFILAQISHTRALTLGQKKQRCFGNKDETISACLEEKRQGIVCGGPS